MICRLHVLNPIKVIGGLIVLTLSSFAGGLLAGGGGPSCRSPNSRVGEDHWTSLCRVGGVLPRRCGCYLSERLG